MASSRSQLLEFGYSEEESDSEDCSLVCEESSSDTEVRQKSRKKKSKARARVSVKSQKNRKNFRRESPQPKQKVSLESTMAKEPFRNSLIRYKKSKLAPGDRDIMVILIDYDVGQKYLARDKKLFSHVVDAIIVLGNAHLMGRTENELVIYGVSGRSVDLIYPGGSGPKIQNHPSAMEQITRTRFSELLRRKLAEIKGNRRRVRDQGPTLMCGALGKALSYVQRRRREIPESQGNVQGRVLIVSGSELGQHSTYMNMINAARTTQVTIDVCAIEVETQFVLRQAALTTDGYFLANKEVDGLLTRLLGYFLMPPADRKLSSNPKQPPVKMKSSPASATQFSAS